MVTMVNEKDVDQPDERVSELAFRLAMPRMVDGFAVVHADGYVPGDLPGSYATIAVITLRGEYPYRAHNFCVHTLIWAHDRERPADRWRLDNGLYDLDSLAAARQRLAERITREPMVTPGAPVPEFVIGYDSRDPVQPYVAQRTSVLGRAGTLVQANQIIRDRIERS